MPCLLPSRVRRLGGIVYPERRKLTQATATVCELKGGEYTAYDRARPESAVAFFTPLANEGDPTAQTKLGEVYEYLFDPPRYDDAAPWYRKAADQNDPAGLRRLAHLYEFGLGVPQDPLLATNLWRRAIGGNEDFVLASTLQSVQTAADQKIAELTTALRARNADADALSRALAAAQSKLAGEKKALAAAETNAATLQRELAAARSSGGGADPERVRQLETQLAEQQRKLDDQRYQTQAGEIALGSQKAQLEASLKQAALENQRLEQELAKATSISDSDLKESEQLLAKRNDEIAALKDQQSQLLRQLDDQRAKFDGVSKDLAKAQTGEATNRDAQARAAALETQRQQQSADLAKSEATAQALKNQLAAAEAEAQQLRASLDTAAHDRERLEAQIAKTEIESRLDTHRPRHRAGQSGVAARRDREPQGRAGRAVGASGHHACAAAGDRRPRSEDQGPDATDQSTRSRDGRAEDADRSTAESRAQCRSRPAASIVCPTHRDSRCRPAPISARVTRW